MAFCNKCGTRANEGKRFCTKCGNAIGTSGASQTGPATAPSVSAPPPVSAPVAPPPISAPYVAAPPPVSAPPGALLASSVPGAGNSKKSGNPALIIAACVGGLVSIGAVAFVLRGVMADNAFKMSEEHRRYGIRSADAGNYRTAAEEFDAAIEQLRKSGKGDADAHAELLVLRGRAQIAGLAGTASAIGENFREVALTRPEEWTPRLTAALDRAVEYFTEAIAVDPQNAVAFRERGRAYNWKGENEQAISDFDSAIRLDPEYVFAYNSRGILHSSMKNDALAIEDYSRVMEIDPNFAIAYRNRAGVYARNELYELAAGDFEASLRIDPDHAGTKKSLEWVQNEHQRQLKQIRAGNRDIRVTGAWAQAGEGCGAYDLQPNGNFSHTDADGIVSYGAWRADGSVLTLTYSPDSDGDYDYDTYGGRVTKETYRITGLNRMRLGECDFSK